MIMPDDKIQELLKTGMIGHVLIKDKLTGEVLVDKFNSINYGNMALTLTRGLADRPDGHIQEMHFGNGAATVNGVGAIQYLPPNVVGRDAALYNDTYYKVVDPTSSLNTDNTQNRIDVLNLSEGLNYSDVLITCTLGYNEPAGQPAYDDATDLSNDYVFNELGLFAYSALGAGEGLMISHVVFSPIAKSQNRIIQILYSLRISMA